MNIQLACDEDLHFKTKSNVCASSGFKQITFSVCSAFELLGIAKHLVIGPKQNNEFDFL